MATKIPLQSDNLDKIPQISDDIKNMLRSNSKIFLGKEAPYCFLSRVERSYAELTIGCNLKHMVNFLFKYSYYWWNWPFQFLVYWTSLSKILTTIVNRAKMKPLFYLFKLCQAHQFRNKSSIFKHRIAQEVSVLFNFSSSSKQLLTGPWCSKHIVNSSFCIYIFRTV